MAGEWSLNRFFEVLYVSYGSNLRLDEVEVDELKKKLEDRDVALTDIRLDALDKAREVDILRETVNRLKVSSLTQAVFLPQEL